MGHLNVRNVKIRYFCEIEKTALKNTTDAKNNCERQKKAMTFTGYRSKSSIGISSF